MIEQSLTACIPCISQSPVVVVPSAPMPSPYAYHAPWIMVIAVEATPTKPVESGISGTSFEVLPLPPVPPPSPGPLLDDEQPAAIATEPRSTKDRQFANCVMTRPS